MSVVPSPRWLTPAEYLARERVATEKSEYYRGELFAMSGGTRNHSLIGVNLARELSSRLKGRPCEAHGADMRVKIPAVGLYTYPDLSALCGPAEFDDELRDTLVNPQVIVEVLSKSSEAYDRGNKFALYRRLESLREYELVAQDQIRVEHYLRQGNRWLLTEFNQLDDLLPLPTLGCEVPLRELYDRVEFEEAATT